jgi:hypothetical protein
MSELKDCYRGHEILFLIEEFLADHPEGSLHGFGRYLMDRELEIRGFTVKEDDGIDSVDRSNWPKDISEYVHDMWTGKLV